MKIRILLIVASLIFLAGSEIMASDYVSGELLVKYRPGAYPKNLQGELGKIGWAKTKVTRSRTMSQAMMDLKSTPDIIQVEYHYYGVFLSEPDDPDFDLQWHLNNTGQTGGTEDADIDAPDAWDMSTGQGVIIGLVDSGVDLTHEDLTDNICSNEGEVPGDGIDNDGNGHIDDVNGWDFGDDDDDPNDEYGHGTQLCGVIAASQNNGLGVSGVAPESKILPLKISEGTPPTLIDSAVAEAIIYAADYGAKIINLSLKFGDEPQVITDAVAYAINKGVLLVGAAGQYEGEVVNFPAKLEDVIAVSATNDTDTLWFRSNFGSEIELSAPGDTIYTTKMGGGYDDVRGTSLATAIVSAVAALIVANHPEFTREQIRNRLINSVDDLGAPGKDIYFGYGRVNAFNPLDPVTTSSSPSTSTTSTTTTITSTTTTSMTSSTTTTSVKRGLCLAIKIYGEDSDEVAILRYLRDNVLNRTPEGREIIRLYYRWNPMIVRAMKMDEEFKEQLKEMIDCIVLLVTAIPE
jgi:subtilisin family serine protease